MNERNLEFEKAMIGWLAHSERGLQSFRYLHLPRVYTTTATSRFIDFLLEHGSGSASLRLKELSYSGAVDPQEADSVVRWAQENPQVDDAYMLEACRIYLRQRAQAVYAEQLTIATGVWDDNLQKAAEKEMLQRLARLADDKKEDNGFSPNGVLKAFSEDERENLFDLPGYAGRMFDNRLKRGDLVTFQAQPKIGKTAMLVRLSVAAMRYGRRVLYLSVGDMDQYEAAVRLLTCESQRNSMAYEETDYVATPCCAKALVGCEKPCFADCDYAPLTPPVAAQYLEETEVHAILQAFPSFKPCTLCRGTPDYIPSVWWKQPEEKALNQDDAIGVYTTIRQCGEYGEIESLFRAARKVTVSDISGMLTERKRYGKAVDVVVVDYADLLGVDDRKNKWEALQSMWEELRALAAEHECLALTATQGNRAGGDMTTQSTTTLAGTRASADNSTLLVALNQTPSERAHHILRLSILAARVGAFAPEHQAMCISRMDIQDPIYDSWHKWVKTDKRKE